MAAARSSLLLVASALIALVDGAQGCVYEYGTIAEAAAIAGGAYNYAFNGLSWANRFKQCRGSKQSPIMLPAAGAAAAALPKADAKSTFSYGNLTNAVIVNNGHTLQVALPESFTADVQIPVLGNVNTTNHLSVLNGAGNVSYVKATPAQFHFHTTSEHLISGAQFPLELHIVHFILPDQLPACGQVEGYPGCPAVLGIMFALTDNEDDVKPELRRLVKAMPRNEGQNTTITGELDVGALLPDNRTYMTYEGSLTTPPCSEGILWHVLTTPVKISQSLLTRYQEAVGDLYCRDEDDDDDRLVPHDQPQSNGSFFPLPPPNQDGCYKLANGHNNRAFQPLNGRVIKVAT